MPSSGAWYNQAGERAAESVAALHRATGNGLSNFGHSDIPGNAMFSPSWNPAHLSANCSEAGLTMRGGAGRLYCFASN